VEEARVASEITTLLGKDARFEGKLTFEGTVRVDGKFKGEVRSGGTLVVGNGSEVVADVEVAHCIIEGDFSGNLRAHESVEIHAPARVKGSVTTPSLQVEKGVLLDGKCVMGEAARSEPEEPEIERVDPPEGGVPKSTGMANPTAKKG